MRISDWSSDVCSSDLVTRTVCVDKEMEADHHRCIFPSKQATQAAAMDDIDKFIEDELQEQEARIATIRAKLGSAGQPVAPRDCEDCGQAIPLRRLEAFRAAMRCVDCQYSQEAR